MDLEPADVHQFIIDAKKTRQNWFDVAERSWQEIKKRQKNNQIWSITPNAVRKRSRYPAWFSIFKIRQPLLLARSGTPICKDTSESGTDTLGATAAILRERLAINLAKDFEFFEVMAACRDDFLATNFSTARALYECKEVKERVRIQLKPVQVDEQNVVFVTQDNKVIESDAIQQDEQGFFLETEEVTDVEEEKVYLEPVPWFSAYIDPTARRWPKVRKVATECEYAEREFRLMFGQEGMDSVPLDKRSQVEGNPNSFCYKVFEYWDFYDKECYWLAENGDKFIKPLGYSSDNDDPARNGVYDLSGFFPFVKPLTLNQAPDEYWPTPEYYQLVEIFEDIHSIFSRMVTATRAFRTRLLFDNNIEGLAEAIKEAVECDAFGVSNLTEALKHAGGKLANVAQYIDVAPIIAALEQLSIQLESRLKMVFNLTGTNDLLQGLTSDGSGKTLGERQLEEKYAINQLEDAQRKMAEFVRDSYELLTELALKNMKDSTLVKYIMPSTLEPEHQKQWQQALALLKSDPQRFRTDLETDSTIAINERYQKEMSIELVNTLTGAIEKTATTAKEQPALVKIELHALKFLIQSFRQGKLFQAEITEAIDNVIKGLEQQEGNAPPDPAMLKIQLDQQKNQADAQLKAMKIQSDERVKMMELQQSGFFAQLDGQLDQLKIINDTREGQEQIKLKYQELFAQIEEARARVALEREALFVRLREIGSKVEAEQFRAQVEGQFKPFEQQLNAYELQLRRGELELERRNQDFQAYNAQIDNMRQGQRLELDAKALQHEISKPPEDKRTININVQEPKTKKTKVKIGKSGGSVEETIKGG